MTSRCGGYWSLMIQRDRAAQALAEIRKQNPNGAGRVAINHAENVEYDAQERQTAHLQTCPICGRWREEMTVLAERAPVWVQEGNEE